MGSATFRIIYKYSNFAALQAEKVPSEIKFNGEHLWPYPKDQFIDYDFIHLKLHDFSNEYTGHISIRPISFELESFEKVKDRELDLQRTPHGYVKLPTVTIEASIRIENLRKAITQTLKWYNKITREIDYPFLARKSFENNFDLLKVILKDEEKLIEYVKKQKKHPNLIHILVTPDDDFENDMDERLVEKQPELEEDEEESLRIIHALFQQVQLESIPGGENFISNLRTKIEDLIPLRAIQIERKDKTGKKLKWKKYWKIFHEQSKVLRKKSRKPPDVDFEKTEEFAVELFQIFRHYLNLIVRYFKYEQMQHWMQELPDHQQGLFFIENQVFMDDLEIIPYARSHIDLMLNTEETRYIDKSKWNDILQKTSDEKSLIKYAGGFEIGGIFSQAYEALTEREFEKAVIIALIGLDTAMTDALERSYPDVAHSTPGPKIGTIMREFKSRGKIGLSDEEWSVAWNHIDCLSTREGLLQLRNDVVHKDKKLPSTDIRFRKHLVEVFSSTRLVAYRLIAWGKGRPRLQPTKKPKKSKTKKPRTRRN